MMITTPQNHNHWMHKNYKNPWFWNQIKNRDMVIMAVSFVGGVGSLASHTFSPFHSEVGWNHRASWQTSSHHHLHASLVVPFSLLWNSTRLKGGAGYTCGISPPLPTVHKQNHIIWRIQNTSNTIWPLYISI